MEEDGSNFWLQYWDALDAVLETLPEEDAATILQSFRKCASASLQKLNGSLFETAWAAHTLLVAPADSAPILAGHSFSWIQRIGCAVLLESCCGETDLSKSAFFSMFIGDTLYILKQSGGIEQACLYEIVESFMPEIVGQEVYATIEKTASEGSNLSQEMQQHLDNCLKKFTSDYQQGNYVSPLLLFPPEQNKAADILKLVRAYQTDDEEGKQDDEEKPVLGQDDILKPFDPLEIPFARPLPPPLLPLYGYDDTFDEPLTEEEVTDALDHLHAELIWLTPTNLRLMLLPEDDSEDADREARYQQILELLKNKAFLKPLAPNEQRMVMEILNEDNNGNGKGRKNGDAGRLIEESGLAAETLPRLVENNPMVAHECLLRVLNPANQYSEDDKNEYLSGLVSMDMSLHTMEVVNRLATYPSSKPGAPRLLHPEYIHLFINSCIASCENIPDRHAQNRLVRLVCVFIQSLIRKSIVQVEDIYFEVQSFCVQFSRMREAAALYKTMKTSGG